MKTTSSKANRVFRTISFASLFLLFSASSDAQIAVETAKTPQIEIKYLGSVNADPVFQIELDNPGGREVYLTLKDEYGNIFYSEFVKDKTFSKKIRFEDFEFDNAKLHLTLRAKKLYEVQTFKVSRDIRTIEEVDVAKL